MHMSRRGYAKHRGVSEGAVRKAIKEGRITVEVNNKIDPVKADKQWEKNSDAVQVETQNKNKKKQNNAHPDLFSQELEQTETTKEAEDENTAGTQSLNASRAEKEQYLAAIKKLEYEKLTGELIPRHRVEKKAFEIAQMVNRSVMNLPARISAELAAMSQTAQVSLFLEKQLRAALEELANTIAIEDIGEDANTDDGEPEA